MVAAWPRRWCGSLNTVTGLGGDLIGAGATDGAKKVWRDLDHGAAKAHASAPRTVPATKAGEVAASSGPQFKTWNQFQAGTKGQFASRADAGRAWAAYKQANGIVTGSVRSRSAVRNYLKGLANDPNTPSSMKPWLEKGRVPPGYEVDHIKPLSIGGADNASNMRLQLKELHDLHHKYYRPWE